MPPDGLNVGVAAVGNEESECAGKGVSMCGNWDGVLGYGNSDRLGDVIGCASQRLRLTNPGTAVGLRRRLQIIS